MNRLWVCCLLAALILCAGVHDPLEAATIYSQVGSSAPIGAYSSNRSGSPADQKIADNFLFNGLEPATIRSLRFVGGYGVRNPPPQTPPLNLLPTDDFEIAFFVDLEGTPGAPLTGGDFHIGNSAQRFPTGGPLLVGVDAPLEYFVDLGAGITLSPSTVYWISIVNSPGTNYFWDWAGTAGAFDQRVASTYGDIASAPWSVSNGGGMYFELRDTNVPEPTSSSVAAITFVVLALATSRRAT